MVATRARAGRMRVAVRVRPAIEEDYDMSAKLGDDICDECVQECVDHQTMLLRKPFHDTREFQLDTVLGREATQVETYDAIGRELVSDVLEGFNGTILAYGQSGTGKTHTVYGPLSYWQHSPVSVGIGGGLGRVAPQSAAPQLPMQPKLELSGIVTRAAMHIFAHIDSLRQSSWRFRVTLSSLQIWQEAISDLLSDRGVSGPLSIREDPGRGVYVEGLTEHTVEAPETMLALVQESATNRATCGTSMNRTSSRSHALLLLRVKQWTEPADEAAAETLALQSLSGEGREAADRLSVASSAPGVAVRQALLSIVDLAGSERVCKSGSEGMRLEEAKRINKSIAALGNCIAALASANGKRSAHVPFRDSKLTRLLTDSLGGNTNTSLCACVGPALHNYDETFCTLLLATRARVVRTHARINEQMERTTSGAPQALMKQMRALQSEVARLRKENAERRVPRPPPAVAAPSHAAAPVQAATMLTPLPPPPSWAALGSQPAVEDGRGAPQGAPPETTPMPSAATLVEQALERTSRGDAAVFDWPASSYGMPQEMMPRVDAAGRPAPPAAAAAAALPATATPYDLLRARVTSLFADDALAPTARGSSVALQAQMARREAAAKPTEVAKPTEAVVAAETSAPGAASLASGVPEEILPPGRIALHSLIGSMGQAPGGGVDELPGEGEGEVLDQLVSGLLATPCIRRRLDQLYGRLPKGDGGDDHQPA